jgi:hypothetical protein
MARRDTRAVLQSFLIANLKALKKRDVGTAEASTIDRHIARLQATKPIDDAHLDAAATYFTSQRCDGLVID